jgi:hypothetical protein
MFAFEAHRITRIQVYRWSAADPNINSEDAQSGHLAMEKT